MSALVTMLDTMLTRLIESFLKFNINMKYFRSKTSLKINDNMVQKNALKQCCEKWLWKSAVFCAHSLCWSSTYVFTEPKIQTSSELFIGSFASDQKNEGEGGRSLGQTFVLVRRMPTEALFAKGKL